MSNIQYCKFAFNNFKIVPRVQGTPYKNYTMDILPTINMIVVRKFVEAFSSLQEYLETSGRSSIMSTVTEDIIDKMIEYTEYNTGTGRTMVDCHDAMLNLTGFSDWAYDTNEGLASLYGTFSKIEPTRWHKNDKTACDKDVFLHNILANTSMLRQYMFSSICLDDRQYQTWYTPALMLMQPEAILKMTSVLFYATVCILTDLDSMSELYVLSDQGWTNFIWLYWLKNVAKKAYPFLSLPAFEPDISTFESIKKTWECTDEQFCLILSMYNPMKPKFPKNAVLINELLLDTWLKYIAEREDRTAVIEGMLKKCRDIYDGAGLKLSGSGEVISAASENADNKKFGKNGKSVIKCSDEKAAKAADLAELATSTDFSLAGGVIADTSKAKKSESKTFYYINPDKATLAYSSKPFTISDVNLIRSYYRASFMTILYDTYRSIILPQSIDRHLSFYGGHIMPLVAELELNRQLSDKRIGVLTETIDNLKEKVSSAPVATKSRDDKLKEYYEEAMTAAEKNVSIAQSENDTLREHIAYLESCIKDSKVIEESNEAFKVLTTEEKCECIKNSGKRIILVGAHKINDLEDYTGNSVEQRYGEDLVKVRNSMKMNKGVYDYVFINSRAISHSAFFGLKSDYKDNATKVISISVSNARLVVDAIYAELFSK